MRVYRGYLDGGGGVKVRDANSPNCKPLNPRLDLRNHSPTGFAWGYGGSGPSQLALALLADATSDDLLALRLYQDFKRSLISSLPMDEGWELSQAFIQGWVISAMNPPDLG